MMFGCFPTAVLRIAAAIIAVLVMTPAHAEDTKRGRDLGIPFPGQPGPLNAITDVAGVEVGHTTLIRGNGRLRRGRGPVRTGVTAIHPRGKDSTSPVFGGWFTLNASGEMTGTTWLEERGLVDGPIMITNTHSVGVARDAAVEWMVDQGWPARWHAPVAAETYDGTLSDINGFHVKREHALDALANASGGPVLEGNVGGGTGMICHRFKGGIGTSSRIVEYADKSYTVGVLVQCNYGGRASLKHIASVPVGELQPVDLPCYEDPRLRPEDAHYKFGLCDDQDRDGDDTAADGSIIIVVATDAPLLPHQLNRMAKRPSLAMGRIGGISSAGSGDIFIAFSTAFEGQLLENNMSSDIIMWPNNRLSSLFSAVVDATEEAIVNAMVAAETMTGNNRLRVHELPEDQLQSIMERAREAN